MKPIQLLSILVIISLMLTTILSESSWLNNDDEDAPTLSKRNLFNHHHHHHKHHEHGQEREGDYGQSGNCVRCGFGIFRCCSPNICVKRRLRKDKCLRVKG